MVSMLWITFCIPAVVVVLFSSINCELTVGPSDVYGVTGSTVTLHCSTNLSVPVQWDFRKVGAQTTNDHWDLIYFGYPLSHITARYRKKNKYAVTVDSTGNEYNLMIYNLQIDDAGTYRCIDDYGFGGHKHDEGIPHHEYRAEVVLIEGNLRCFQFINESEVILTNFELGLDDKVKLGCTIACVGNISLCPEFLWSVFHVESGIETLIDHPHSRTTEFKFRFNRTITSEIEINSTVLSNQSHIMCNLTGPVNRNLVFASNSDRLHADWIVNVSDNRIDLLKESGHQNDGLRESTSNFTVIAMVITGISGILLGVLIGVCTNSAILLKKSGYKITAKRLIRFYEEVKIDNLQESDSSEIEKLLTKIYKSKGGNHAPSDLWKMVEYLKWVAGVSIMDDQIFVIRNKQSGVEICDANTFNPLSNIEIPGMKKPRGIVACHQNNSLYISDNGRQRIHVVTLNDKIVKSWDVPYHSPQGLSMTLEGNILLAIWKKPCRILEYSTEGQPIHDIELDESIEAIYEAVKLSNDQFIICHGMIRAKLHRICVVNCKGTVTRSYGEDGQGQWSLYFPCSVALDRKRDILFVVDCGNQRVLMFKTDLTPLSQVNLSKELKFPTRVYFDAIRDILIIGDATGGFYQVNSSEFEDKIH